MQTVLVLTLLAQCASAVYRENMLREDNAGSHNYHAGPARDMAVHGKQLVRAIACEDTTTLAQGDTVAFGDAGKKGPCNWHFITDEGNVFFIQCKAGGGGCNKKNSVIKEEDGSQTLKYCHGQNKNFTTSTNNITFAAGFGRRSDKKVDCTITVMEITTTTTTTTMTTTTAPVNVCEANDCSKCGTINRAEAGRILGGAGTEANEYPFMVAIWVVGETRPRCGGVIINPCAVLTTAICAVSSIPQNLRVWYGGHAIANSGSFVEVTSVVYDTLLAPTLAVLKLKDSLDFSQLEVGPVCLPAINAKAYVGETATITGWGFTNIFYNEPLVLQETTVKVLSTAPAPFYMVASTKGQEPCFGDHGGPMFVEEGGRATLIGLIGLIADCISFPLLPEVPVYYFRVTHYLTFIRAQNGTCTNP